MTQILRRGFLLGSIVSLFAVASAYAHGPHKSAGQSFLASLSASPLSASTVPGNGDGNPYGVAIVPHGFPAGPNIAPGDILVSNFNNSGGKQGEGTTIVSVTPSGSASTFFTAPSSLGPVGLTTALVALRSGVVVVGNTPTTDGTSTTVSDGSLIFLDRNGNVLLNLTSSTLLHGPWDMTAADSGHSPTLYVSDVLSGTITRIRLDIHRRHGAVSVTVDSMTQIASGFMHRTDPAALLVGPTGLLLGDGNSGRGGFRHNHGSGQTLFVADTGNNRVQELTDVGRSKVDQGAGTTVASGVPFQGPLALAWAPNGDIVASNGDAAGPTETASTMNLVVEINPRSGKFVDTLQLDTSGTAGAIFGITIGRVNGHTALIYVNDNTNSLNILPVK